METDSYRTGRWRKLIDNFPLVALLAVDGFAAVRRVRRNHLPSALVAIPLEELAGTPERHAVEVALVGMPSWNREVMFSVKLEFLLDYPEGFSGSLAFDGPIQNVVRDFGNVVRELVCQDNFFQFREWGLIVGPIESAGKGLFPSYGKIFVREGFVVPKWRKGGWKEFAPFKRLHHVGDDFRDEFFILLLSVLLIENAVGFMIESDAGEAIGTGTYKAAIRHVAT